LQNHEPQFPVVELALAPAAAAETPVVMTHWAVKASVPAAVTFATMM
jgi:hypothetical protein